MHFYHHVTHEREMHESAEKESRLIQFNAWQEVLAAHINNDEIFMNIHAQAAV